MSDIKNYRDLLNKTTAVLVLDLSQYACVLDQKLVNALIEPKKGIYIPGQINPIIYFNTDYYIQSLTETLKFQIKTISELLKVNNTITNINGDLVISKRQIQQFKKYFTTEPLIPANILNVAITVVLNYLNNLCVHTRCRSNNYNLYKFVKSEQVKLIEEERYELAFESLLDRVMEFVGSDTWHIYHYKINGTTMIIEKTIDFRIFQWYEDRLSKKEDSE